MALATRKAYWERKRERQIQRSHTSFQAEKDFTAHPPATVSEPGVLSDTEGTTLKSSSQTKIIS